MAMHVVLRYQYDIRSNSMVLIMESHVLRYQYVKSNYKVLMEIDVVLRYHYNGRSNYRVLMEIHVLRYQYNVRSNYRVLMEICFKDRAHLSTFKIFIFEKFSCFIVLVVFLVIAQSSALVSV